PQRSLIMSDRDSDFGNFLSGFFMGGLIGAAVALLMAPQSGEETRTVIRDKSIEFKDKTVSSVEEAYAKAESAAADARARADELAQVARTRASELKARGQVVLEEQKSRLENVMEAAKKPEAKVAKKPAAKKTTSSTKTDENK
ncbi:MAG: YtxH domain-containing protein, partial [Chloroflexota bacterium]